MGGVGLNGGHSQAPMRLRALAATIFFSTCAAKASTLAAPESSWCRRPRAAQEASQAPGPAALSVCLVSPLSPAGPDSWGKDKTWGPFGHVGVGCLGMAGPPGLPSLVWIIHELCILLEEIASILLQNSITDKTIEPSRYTMFTYQIYCLNI